jgi:L-alanine-DL-glutamate epimerase-like enolase superfamily enzyme
LNNEQDILAKNYAMQSIDTIHSISIYKLFVPLKEPFVISLGPIHHVQNVVVVIKTKNGISGFGECSPYMTINGESVDTCFIVGQYFAKVLKGKEALDIAACCAIMDKTIYANYSIKSAFDIALHDVAAQHAGVPLYQFLGGKKDKILTTDMTVSIGSPEKMQQDAIQFKAAGFPAIKVKLGESLERDVARIKAIREGIGNDIPLRIDANQGWQTADNAIAVLNALAPHNIEHCEEPIARWRFMELSKVSAASPIPIMADESCGDHHDAERLIALKACPLFNIKLGKTGGLLDAMKIVKQAAAANMHLQIGGFMESRLGMTAGAHLALSNEHIVHCDFDTPLMFTEDPVGGGIEYKQNGIIEVPDVQGLGATIKEEYLKGAEQVTI